MFMHFFHQIVPLRGTRQIHFMYVFFINLSFAQNLKTPLPCIAFSTRTPMYCLTSKKDENRNSNRCAGRITAIWD